MREAEVAPLMNRRHTWGGKGGPPRPPPREDALIEGTLATPRSTTKWQGVTVK